MSNYSLKALSPLGDVDPKVDEIGKTRIVEVIDYALASLSQRVGKEKPFTAAAKKMLKLALPQPGMSVTKGGFTVFWAGQQQWFVEAPEETHEDIAEILSAVFDDSASITEQSGGWCRFDVEGEASIRLFERLCNVDIATMATDAATRSVIEHIGTFIVCRDAGKHFSVYGPRSSAQSLHHALTTAAKSIA